jgi:anthranilate synthase component 1
LTKEKYKKMVQKAKDYIIAGDALQILISQRFSSDFDQTKSFDFYRSLRSVNPSPFMFFVNFDDFNIIGSSPEILSSLKDNKVTIRPLAGTRKRGKNKDQDRQNAKELLADEKEIAEHLMLIDLGRNDVGKICQKQSVKVTEQMIIEYYSHVMHISSNVEGVILPHKDALDVLISSFPAGTVSGAPKIRAMQIIEEIEEEKRGFYAGSVGYFSANGDMEHCICLRTSLIKNNKIYLHSGAGIVYDSVLESEYQECLNKAEALMRAVKNCDNL